MGRATRWLKALFGIKKERQHKECNSKSSLGNSGSKCNNNTRLSSFVGEAAWHRNFYSETEKEQNKHAIAVAAATAAAADAAVAAAQAAVAVVRLTSHERGTMFGGGSESLAALKIQATFRGYLARKALRALKGLVKLQALVRGYLVRKQANTTLQSIQAIMRVQTNARNHRIRGDDINNRTARKQIRSRKSMERLDESRSDYTTSNSIHSHSHSRRLHLSTSLDTAASSNTDETLKINICKSKPRSRRTNTLVSDYYEKPNYAAMASPLQCRTPARLSLHNARDFRQPNWGLMDDECKCSTAQTTPRFTNLIGSDLPTTPCKSICADDFFRGCGDVPNYMTNTQSFKAKLRSYSAPRLRPETELLSRKRVSLQEMMESRSSLSGVRMQRTCSRAQEVISFKNAIMGKLDRSRDLKRW